MNPFLLWAFLNALEESGSAVSRHTMVLHCFMTNKILQAQEQCHSRLKSKAGSPSMYFCMMTAHLSLWDASPFISKPIHMGSTSLTTAGLLHTRAVALLTTLNCNPVCRSHQ